MLETIKNRIKDSRFGIGLRELRRDLLFPRLVVQDIRDNEKIKFIYTYLLKPDSNCIDIGAHIGDYLTIIKDLAPLGKHIAVEPLPHLAEQLKKEFSDIVIYQAALSDRSGSAEFVHVKYPQAWSGLKAYAYSKKVQKEYIKVRLAKLVDLLPSGYRPDLIKVDVEGAELEVFRGTLVTLQKYHPYLLFEHYVNSYKAFGTQPGDVWDLLVRDCKYRIFDLYGNGSLSRKRFSDLADTRKQMNFIAHL